MSAERPIIICTRGSALALAQANHVIAECRKAFPRLRFELKIIKTTGDKLLTASLANPDKDLPKGLFTKELEVALVKQQADLAVHSLKDLPTELPSGLVLGAVGKRADVRDVMIYRSADFLANQQSTLNQQQDWSPGQSQLTGLKPKTSIKSLPQGAVIATSSTRRRAQLQALRPDLKFTELRGNVVTRMEKLAGKAELDATVLAAAGLGRLNFTLTPDGRLVGDAVPDGLLATVLDTDAMLPAVGQAAVGIEIRAGDERIEAICARLNHFNTLQAVTAERAFLAGMGGGCASPVGAYAEVEGEQIKMRVVSFVGGGCRRAAGKRPVKEAKTLGEALAAELKKQVTT
jgi:hydroxymethylbilane synthase